MRQHWLKKWIYGAAILLLVGMLPVGLSAQYAPAYGTAGISVVVDGQLLSLDQPAAMNRGRVMVPLRGIFESLGAVVDYDPATRTIRATRGETEISLFTNSSRALVNGEVRILDAPPILLGSRVLVPLRFVSEALGAEVRWQAYNRTVNILSLTGGVSGTPTYTPPTAGGPRIYSVTHNAADVLLPGDRLTVVLSGETGGAATFDIPGVVNNLSMTEVALGRYEGTYSIPAGIQVSNIRIVGHLRLHGRESLSSSTIPISIGSTGGTQTRIMVSPQAGTTVAMARPQISVAFPTDIQPATVRLLLDGVDYTSQARISANTVAWIPLFNLASGEHRVTVTALGTLGEQMRREWNFFVSGTGTGNLGLSLSYPTPGTVVPRTFDVTGVTSPNALVRLRVMAQRTDFFGNLFGIQREVLNTSMRADASGYFTIHVDSGDEPSGTRITLISQAQDDLGMQTGEIRTEITRQ